jgi:phospholipid/cholesterol/gamma-HCH transport system substrate-binding protein
MTRKGRTMESKAFALWSGLFVIALLAALAAVVIWMSGVRQGERVEYTLLSRQSVSGLNREAAVQYRGIPVGKVVELGIDPADPKQVRVRVAVDSTVRLSAQAWARLGTQGLTGLTFVELHDDGVPPWRDPAGAPLPMRPSLWQDTTSKLPAALGEARQLGERLNLLLDDANRRELASLLANLNRFSAQLPALGEQSTATLASARQLADELRQLSQGLRAVLAQAGPAVGQASARLNQDTLPRLDQLASQAEHTAQALDGLIDSHSRRPQQLLLGAPMDPPGPGEAGFAGAAR